MTVLKPVGNQFNFGSNPFDWFDFDRLPDLVKRVIMYAPIQLGTQRASMSLARGMSVEAVARMEVAVARKASREEVVRDYGPDHPQAPKAAV